LPSDHCSPATLASHGEAKGCGAQEACKQEPDKGSFGLEYLASIGVVGEDCLGVLILMFGWVYSVIFHLIGAKKLRMVAQVKEI